MNVLDIMSPGQRVLYSLPGLIIIALIIIAIITVSVLFVRKELKKKKNVK